jgi:hypothetical protein
MTTMQPAAPGAEPAAPKKDAPDAPGGGERRIERAPDIGRAKWLPLRLGLVVVAAILGLAVDLDVLTAPAPAGHVLRFVVFLTVSIAASQWGPWLAGSAFFSFVWGFLVVVDRRKLRYPRLLVGLVARNMGHLEAAFVWTAIAAGLRFWSLMFAAVAAVYALGLTVAGTLGERVIHMRKGRLTVGNLGAVRRVIIALESLPVHRLRQPVPRAQGQAVGCPPRRG